MISAWDVCFVNEKYGHPDQVLTQSAKWERRSGLLSFVSAEFPRQSEVNLKKVEAVSLKWTGNISREKGKSDHHTRIFALGLYNAGFLPSSSKFC